MTPKAGTWTGHRGSVKVKSLQTLFKSYSDVASVPEKIHVGVVLAPGAWESGRGSCFRVGPGCYQVNGECGPTEAIELKRAAWWD